MLLRILLAIPMILFVLVQIFISLLNALFMFFLNYLALVDILFLAVFLRIGYLWLKSISVSTMCSSHVSMYELMSV